MNFCAALYTRSFLCIFVCTLLLVRATLQKAASETSTPIPISLSLLPLFSLSTQFPFSPYVPPPLYPLSVLSSSQLSSCLIAPLRLSFCRLFLLLFVCLFSLVLTFIAPYSCLPCLRKPPQTARCLSEPHRGFCCV